MTTTNATNIRETASKTSETRNAETFNDKDETHKETVNRHMYNNSYNDDRGNQNLERNSMNKSTRKIQLNISHVVIMAIYE